MAEKQSKRYRDQLSTSETDDLHPSKLSNAEGLQTTFSKRDSERLAKMEKQLEKLDMIPALLSEMEALKTSLEYNNNLIMDLTEENKLLRKDVESLQSITTTRRKTNK